MSWSDKSEHIIPFFPVNQRAFCIAIKMTEVTNWYRNKNLFVTGATGFVGKCLVEKLLRECKDIGDIYIMIRDTARADFEQRKKAYIEHIVFSKLAKERPSALNKIKIVKGHLNTVDFGLSEPVKQELFDRVSVIFHVAADVRFDREIVDAYNINVIGTRNMLELATKFNKLDVFVHVSTAFSQPPDVHLEERHYPAVITQQEMAQYVEKIDPDVLNGLTHKYIHIIIIALNPSSNRR